METVTGVSSPAYDGIFDFSLTEVFVNKKLLLVHLKANTSEEEPPNLR
jgi:hypothetical protein